MKKLKYIFATLFILLFNTSVLAQWNEDDDDMGTGTGGKETIVVPNSPPETEGTRKTPINMYEGVLMVVAFLLVVGYYYNERNKRMTNS